MKKQLRYKGAFDFKIIIDIRINNGGIEEDTNLLKLLNKKFDNKAKSNPKNII